MWSYAKSCKVMQGHAKSCKFMQGWVTHQLSQFYPPVTTFHLYSGFFRWLERGGYSSKVPLLLLTVEKIECENFDFALFLLSFFFSMMHNSKSLQCIWTIRTPNESASISDFPFLVRAACELHCKIDKLWPQTLIAVAFLYAIFFLHIYKHNSKSKGCIRMFYLSNDCSTIGDIYSHS